MKLKTRLITAFFVIACVPLILALLAFAGFSHIQVNALKAKLGITDISYESLANTLQMLNEATEDVFDEMSIKAEENADAYLDTTYLDTLNTELQDKSSYLIVRKGKSLYYSGASDANLRLFRELPSYGASVYKADGTYIAQDVQAYVKQVDMIFSDGDQGSAFIITSVSNTMPELKKLVWDMLIAILMILVLTGALLSAWIYRGINTPMQKLREATQHIKDGDLDFELKVEGKDEFSGLCRDFEEMRQRLRDSNAEKEAYDKENKELISNISHDLKTPITAIKGYVEGIMDGVADTPEKMDKYIRTVYNKANDMDRLINELTFYSKIDTNRIPYNFAKINVSDYFDDCVEDVGLELESKNIELSYFNYVDKGTLVIADAEQIKRVINNIISNSIKYLDKQKGYISIRVRDVGDFIQVEIEDNGKGIAAKDLPNIFDRFYRTDSSRNSSKGGSGIGLSIVKKIIEDHGGKIWANSKLGAGTVMYFVLRKYQEVPIINE